MSFERARAVADAVLFEGYVLYPYRASSCKNQFRWTFGVLAPRTWSEAGGCEPWWMQTECLLSGGREMRIEARLRFLQLRQRRLEIRGRPAERVAGQPWEEGDVREVEVPVELGAVWREERCLAFEVPGGLGSEPVLDDERGVVGHRVQEWWPIRGTVRVRAEPVEAPRPLVRLRIRIENRTAWRETDARREAVLRASCVSTHLLIAASGGGFVSLLDPPAWAAAETASCENVRMFPVLAGPQGHDDLLLSSPIILYDHPLVAPESPGDFFDATEIDELLALRTSLLTDDEKRQARATDPRCAAIIDRVEALSPDALDRLHGAIRQLRGGEMTPLVPEPASGPVRTFTPGVRVRLCPGPRRTDAQDLLFAGCTATIEKVMQDIDGRHCYAVTIDGDPAAELHRWYGRFHYYYADEIELLPPMGEEDA